MLTEIASTCANVDRSLPVLLLSNVTFTFLFNVLGANRRISVTYFEVPSTGTDHEDNCRVAQIYELFNGMLLGYEKQ